MALCTRIQGPAYIYNLKKIKSEYFTSDICAFNLEVLVLMIKQKLMLKASDMHAKWISSFGASVKTGLVKSITKQKHLTRLLELVNLWADLENYICVKKFALMRLFSNTPIMTKYFHFWLNSKVSAKKLKINVVFYNCAYN